MKKADADFAALMLEVQRQLADRGKLIEAGWVGFRRLVLPADTGDAQVRDMQLAFFAGAKHLFDTVMSVLDPGEEPTEADLRRMEHVAHELEKFNEEMVVRFSRPGGHA